MLFKPALLFRHGLGSEEAEMAGSFVLMLKLPPYLRLLRLPVFMASVRLSGPSLLFFMSFRGLIGDGCNEDVV